MFADRNIVGIIESLILGTVQGLTEFLPVSSTAHLILVPWFLKIPDPGLYFDTALHLGTLLAVLLFFGRDFVKILLHERQLLKALIVATIPGALFGALLESKVETIFRSPLLIALTLALFGVVIWYIDKTSRTQRTVENLNLKDAVLIGLSQVLALVPGVSRSGITMMAGRYRGFTREVAVRFSFLLSAPIILGSSASSFIKIFKGGEANFNILNLGAALLMSFVFGFLSIKFLVKYISKNNFNVFVIYRLALASFILLKLLYD